MSIGNNEWHLRDPEAVASLLDTDIYRGLEPSQVSKRRRREGKNKIWHIKRTSATEYSIKSLGDLTAAVLIIAALTAAVFEKSVIAVSVCAILALGVIFRVITYVKARHILEQIADEGIPSASVIRGGEALVVRADEIVAGDLVVLGPGDIVPCDGRIVYGDEVRVSEKGITDNKTSVIKGDTVILTDTPGSEIPCEYRVNMLFAGSAVLAGSCRIVATATGDDALVSMRHGGLLVSSGEDIPVMNELNEWCRRGSIAMLLCVLALSGVSVALHLMRGTSFSIADTFIDAMALATASLSSYLYTTGYITLTVPLRHIAERKNGRAVIKDASAVEKIAGVKCVIVADVSSFKSGRAAYTQYYADGGLHDVHKNDERAARVLADVLKTVAKNDTATSLAGAGDAADARTILLEKITNSAKSELSVDAARYASLEYVPLDYKKTQSAGGELYNVILKHGSEYEIHLSGDVREVLSYCSRQTNGNRDVHLLPDDREKILSAAAAIEARGGTVIAKAHRQSIYTTLKRLSVLQSAMIFDGFIVAEEGLDPEFSALAEEIASSALRVVLLSPATELHRGYLTKAGVMSPGTPIITCRDVLEGKSLPEGSFIVGVPERKLTGAKIDEAGKVRIATARKLVESIDGSALITSEPSESGMMTDSAVGSALSDSKHRPIPQTLKRRAEMSVYPKSDAGCGGFSETLRAIAASICSLENLRKTAVYTVSSQGARLICVLLSMLFGVGVMNAANILLLGMIFDFLAVIVLSFAGERRATPDGDEARRALPSLKDVAVGMLKGALAGAVSFAAVMLSSTLAESASLEGMVSALTASLLLVQLILLSETLLDGGVLYRAGETNLSYFLYAALSLAGVLSLTFSTTACSFIGGVCPDWIVSTSSAVAALVFFGIYELFKLIVRKTL